MVVHFIRGNHAPLYKNTNQRIIHRELFPLPLFGNVDTGITYVDHRVGLVAEVNGHNRGLAGQ